MCAEIVQLIYTSVKGYDFTQYISDKSLDIISDFCPSIFHILCKRQKIFRIFVYIIYILDVLDIHVYIIYIRNECGVKSAPM